MVWAQLVEGAGVCSSKTQNALMYLGKRHRRRMLQPNGLNGVIGSSPQPRDPGTKTLPTCTHRLGRRILESVADEQG